MRGKRCSVFMIWKISLHTKCCSRTQILVTRWTRVSRVKEICAGKVCKLTSPLHATLNFITLVTSCGGQRGQSSREYGSIYCPKWATICQYAPFRLQRCKLRKKLRGVWICIFSMKKNKLQSIHSRQNGRWTWHGGHLWYGRQKSGRMSVTGVWIDCDRWRLFLLNCTSTQTQHRGLATLSQFSDYGLMYQVKVGAQM